MKKIYAIVSAVPFDGNAGSAGTTRVAVFTLGGRESKRSDLRQPANVTPLLPAAHPRR